MAGRTPEAIPRIEEAKRLNKPVIIDFFAEWCGPCKSIAPVLEKMSEKFKDKVKICKVNVDHNRKIAIDYHVSAMPTFIFIKDKKELSYGSATRVVGADVAKIQSIIDEHA